MAGTTPEETDQLVNDAVSRQDADAMLDLFEDDAVFVDPESGTELRGHDAIREAIVGFFDSEPKLQGSQPKVFIAGKIALVISEWTMEARGPEGETKPRLRSRRRDWW